MQLKEARQGYYDHSGTTSSIGRKAAYAGIALVWLLGGASFSSGLPSSLVWSLALFAAYLVSDFLQYAVATALWGGFHRYHDKRLGSKYDPEANIDAPGWLNRPGLFFFWLKVLVLLIAYVTVGVDVWSKLKIG